MKIGICLHAKKALDEYPATADYIEVSGTKIDSLEPDLYRQFRKAVADGRIKTYSCNSLIDPSLRLTGPDVNFGAIRDYCDRLFYRLAELKIQMLVFGSGKAKHVPEGFAMEKAWDQLFEIGHILADKAESYGQTVAVEPLSYREVNIVNTVDEAAYYAKTVNRDCFKVLVDFFHFNSNGEDFATLKQNRDLIVHTHFASPETRTLPRTEADWAYFAECIKQLKQIGYGGALSFEGHIHETDDPKAILFRMKKIEQQIGPNQEA